MKRIAFTVLIGTLLLTACGQTPSATQTAPISAVDTTTPSPLPTSTRTSLPTATPTASVTPLPTIPTFTPTFDVSTIVTVTPAPKVECPKIDSTISVEDYLPEKLEYPSPDTTAKILDFLNTGGDGQVLIARLKQIYPDGGDYRGGYAFRDVTGDQVLDFIYVEINYEGKPIIFSCKNGEFELLAILSGEHDSWDYTVKIDNLIADGVPEIIVTGTDGVSFPQSIVYIFGWNGQAFSILGMEGISALRQLQTKDINGNGTKEIILTGDNPGCLSCSDFIPQRQRTITYGWNGKGFVEISNEFEPPEYRFQAIHDADNAVHFGKLDKAFSLYADVVSNEKLEWWSPERFVYEQDAPYRWIPGYTPVPEPIVDVTEYPRLAAYAYYRIMLLHLVQNYESDATTVYNTLQEKFGNDPYARPYVEMATAFWDAYQSTHKMYDGCAAAIQYAAEHPEILTPLGSDYHGWQSHTYVPADVCPFR
jgi:hypothetical protein